MNQKKLPSNTGFISGFKFGVSLQSKRGFTLLETLVAVFMISIAVSATLAAAYSGLKSSYYSRDEVTAVYLAQEALEYIHNLRDTNWLLGKNWTTGFDTDTTCLNTKCTVDPWGTGGPGSFVIQKCPSNGSKVVCPPMQYHSGTGRYGYPLSPIGWKQTPFVRSVSINPVPSTLLSVGNEMRVTVRVDWGKGSVSVTQNLLHWK